MHFTVLRILYCCGYLHAILGLEMWVEKVKHIFHSDQVHHIQTKQALSFQKGKLYISPLWNGCFIPFSVTSLGGYQAIKSHSPSCLLPPCQTHTFPMTQIPGVSPMILAAVEAPTMMDRLGAMNDMRDSTYS